METAKGVGNTIEKGVKDGVAAVNKAVNGANMVQLSSIGLFMTVLAIFNR